MWLEQQFSSFEESVTQVLSKEKINATSVMPIKSDCFRGGENSTNKQIPIGCLPFPAPMGDHLENLVFFHCHVKMMITI